MTNLNQDLSFVASLREDYVFTVLFSSPRTPRLRVNPARNFAFLYTSRVTDYVCPRITAQRPTRTLSQTTFTFYVSRFMPVASRMAD